MFLDNMGLIIQKDQDGGDCLSNEGRWFLAVKLLERPMFYAQQLMAMMPKPIQYQQALFDLTFPRNPVRYPKPPYNDPKDCSRDQIIPNVIACGFYGYTQIVRICAYKVITNYSRYPNGDIAFLQDYGRFFRALNWKWCYPFILISDIFLLINSLLRVLLWRDPDNVGTCINHICDLTQCQYILPTPVSWLSRKLFVRFIKGTSRNKKTVYKGPLEVWGAYYSKESGANTEFVDLWKPIIERL